MTLPVTAADIRAAHGRIASFVRHTPLLDVAPLTPGLPVSLKLEFLQHAGSFKPRGAFNNLLSRAIPAAGVTAASGGNHGAAVAYAARALGHKARIFVPEISSPVKVAKIRAYGADVVVSGARYADALALCETYAQDSGALGIHAYEALETIAGQGTVALEWQAEIAARGMAAIDTYLIAVGGGGLIAGIASWFAGNTRVVGVEPEGSRCLHAALAAGHPVDVDVESIAGDSLGARRVGELAFTIAKHCVDHVALVSNDAIRAAQKALWADYRIAAEPGGAAAFAALLSGAYQPAKDERVGVLLCGGNVDLRALAALG